MKLLLLALALVSLCPAVAGAADLYLYAAPGGNGVAIDFGDGTGVIRDNSGTTYIQRVGPGVYASSGSGPSGYYRERHRVYANGRIRSSTYHRRW